MAQFSTARVHRHVVAGASHRRVRQNGHLGGTPSHDQAIPASWARILQGNGFNEVMNNSLTSVKDETDAVKLLNPLSNDLAFMRKYA